MLKNTYENFLHNLCIPVCLLACICRVCKAKEFIELGPAYIFIRHIKLIYACFAMYTQCALAGGGVGVVVGGSRG